MFKNFKKLEGKLVVGGLDFVAGVEQFKYVEIPHSEFSIFRKV